MQNEFRKVHSITAVHLFSVPTRAAIEEDRIWSGTVEVFMIVGHPAAKTGYAWESGVITGDEPPRYVTILHLPPVDSPPAAVREAFRRGLDT